MTAAMAAPVENLECARLYAAPGPESTGEKGEKGEKGAGEKGARGGTPARRLSGLTGQTIVCPARSFLRQGRLSGQKNRLDIRLIRNRLRAR